MVQNKYSGALKTLIDDKPSSHLSSVCTNYTTYNMLIGSSGCHLFIQLIAKKDLDSPNCFCRNDTNEMYYI